MNYLKKVAGYVRRSRGLKYIIVIAVAIVIVGFVDENSVWNHFRNKRKISELSSEIQRYQNQYERALKQLRQIDTDPKAIEKIARERYFMKADDEDIFVLSDDMQAGQNNDNEKAE